MVFRNEVDITGDSTLKAEEELVTGHRTLLQDIQSWNPWFSSVEGNPFPEAANEVE